MQRSSWQMLQSNLVWQAGHPLIQQIQSHINVTRKECRTFYWLDVIIIVDGEVQGRSAVESNISNACYLDPELFVESTGDEASFKKNHYALRRPVFYFKLQVLPPVVQLSLLQGFDVEVRSLDLKWSDVHVREQKYTERLIKVLRTQHTASSKAQRLLTSCSLWLNSSWRISITLWRMFSISVTLYVKTQTKPCGQPSCSWNHVTFPLLVLQPRIYITISLPGTRSLKRLEVCMHPAF